jgi:hypothetical protein
MAISAGILGKSETSQKLLKTEMRVVGQFEFPKLAGCGGAGFARALRITDIIIYKCGASFGHFTKSTSAFST